MMLNERYDGSVVNVVAISCELSRNPEVFSSFSFVTLSNLVSRGTNPKLAVVVAIFSNVCFNRGSS